MLSDGIRIHRICRRLSHDGWRDDNANTPQGMAQNSVDSTREAA